MSTLTCGLLLPSLLPLHICTLIQIPLSTRQEFSEVEDFCKDGNKEVLLSVFIHTYLSMFATQQHIGFSPTFVHVCVHVCVVEWVLVCGPVGGGGGGV